MSAIDLDLSSAIEAARSEAIEKDLWPGSSDEMRLILAAALPHIRRAVIEELAPLIRDLTDPDECWFDHHGGCQAHGYLSLQPGELCPHQEAKNLLRAELEGDGA